MSITHQRLPRRASTFHQGPSSASSSDSENPAAPHPTTDGRTEQTRRKRLRSLKKWWEARKIGQETADQTSPASSTGYGTNDDNEESTQTDSGGNPWWHSVRSFFPAKPQIARTATSSDSFYIYSDYTSENAIETTSKKGLNVFHYRELEPDSTVEHI